MRKRRQEDRETRSVVEKSGWRYAFEMRKIGREG
jgi:hypothetical protein